MRFSLIKRFFEGVDADAVAIEWRLKKHLQIMELQKQKMEGQTLKTENTMSEEPSTYKRTIRQIVIADPMPGLPTVFARADIGSIGNDDGKKLYKVASIEEVPHAFGCCYHIFNYNTKDNTLVLWQKLFLGTVPHKIEYELESTNNI